MHGNSLLASIGGPLTPQTSHRAPKVDKAFKDIMRRTHDRPEALAVGAPPGGVFGFWCLLPTAGCWPYHS